MPDAALAAALGLAGEAHWGLAMLFLRIGSAVVVLPLFGNIRMPVRVRLVVSFMLVLLVWTALPGRDAIPPPGLGSGLAEIVTGVVLGLSVRMVFFALEICGSIAAQSTSLAQMFGGATGMEQQTAIGNLLILAGLTYAVVLGLHVKTVEFFLISYTLWPAGQAAPDATLTAMGVAQLRESFALGFSLAAPFFLVSVLYNLTLGIINKAMPQLMVAFIGAPAITGAAMLLMLAFAPAMLEHWHSALDMALQTPGWTSR